MTIDPPKQGESTLMLWRKVEELTRAVNALLNAEVRVATKNIKSGKVQSQPDSVVIILE